MNQIVVRGARLHNLKGVTVCIPKDRLVVLTGVSGSGKSTLGFDILYKEGQRQYMETLGLLTFGLARPPVEAITGLSPSVSVDQRLANRSPRSTVGTSTGVYTYLRVLFARLGHRPCPACGMDVPPPLGQAAEWDEEPASELGGVAETATFPCPHCGAPVPELAMASFSFNKPDGACPTCTGLGSIQEANICRLMDEARSIPDGAVTGWDARYGRYSMDVLQAAAAHYGFRFDFSLPVGRYTPEQRDLLLFGVQSPVFRRHFPEVAPPGTVRQGRFEGIATSLLRRYAEHIGRHVGDAEYRDRLEDLVVTETCPDCDGARLRPESRAVTVGQRTIVELSRLPLVDLAAWLGALPAELDPAEVLVAEPLLHQLREGIGRLVDVGVGYLSAERSSPTVSAGEAQRLRLAALLGSWLSGILYVLDEPTVGLHPRDTGRLIGVLARLRDLGNTVLVIEHDLEVIAAADHVVDFGPGAGMHGGQVVAAGTPAEVAAAPRSVTGAYLAGRFTVPVPERRRQPTGAAIIVRGARHHNLQNLTASLPLGLLVAVTGVSGSGKSSLVFDVLGRALSRRLYGATEEPGEHDGLEGAEALTRVITVDQEHLARVPRSNVATYTDVFTSIRQAFAATPAARRLSLSAGRFSFNVPGGRCERCQGTGVLAVRMHFLPDVEVRCPTCHGRRFTPETLEVQYRGHDISQVLELSVEEALPLLRSIPAARSRLQVMADVGLGYLQLGQPAATLSGGEAQRVKLAKELGHRAGGRTLYLLDEPTTGLHPADTARLLGVLQRLVDAGSSVVVVEHNLDLIRAADWVVDLGPEGGAGGGRLVAQGTPQDVAAAPGSYTGQALQAVL